MTDRRRRVTSIDLNRAGAGLMEIVSEPDIRFDIQVNSLSILSNIALGRLKKLLTMSEHFRPF